jgi:hypothetical protein
MLRQKGLPQLFHNGRLLPEIRSKLLQIVNDFFESLHLPTDIIDVIITGSILTPWRTRFSDLDLHILISFDDVSSDEELMQQLKKLSKYRWSHTHSIKIEGFPIEIYLQDINEPHYSDAQYSVLQDEWLKTSWTLEPKVDRELLKRKSRWFLRLINLLEKEFQKGEDISTAAQQTKDYLKRYRKVGLETVGTMSLENLVFKVLRQVGALDKLESIIQKSYDRQFSESGDRDDFIDNETSDKLQERFQAYRRSINNE